MSVQEVQWLALLLQRAQDRFSPIEIAWVNDGLDINGYKDSGGVAGVAARLRGYLAENVDTTKSNAGRAILEMVGFQTSGSTTADTVADGNVWIVRTQRGGTTVSLVIIDEDGDIHRDGTTGTFDEHEDAIAAWDLSHVLAGQWEQVIQYNASLLEQMGIISPPGLKGRKMVSQKRLDMLFMGALGQLHKRLQAQEQRLIKLEG